MIFDDFQSGIVNALKGDAYFSRSPAVLIIPEEDPAEMTDVDFQNHRKQVQASLNDNGIVGVVSEVDYEAAPSPNAYVVRCSIAWFENRRKNKDTLARSGRNCAAKAHAILQRYRVPVLIGGTSERIDPFSPIQIKSCNYVGEEDGTKVREMVVESIVAVDVVTMSLADENAFDLVTENGEPLEVSPTDV